MKINDIVKFSNPVNNKEEALRFIVIEERGSRLLVELITDMVIKPTFVYSTSDLIKVLD